MKWKRPQSIPTFLWLAMKKSLKTKGFLFKRHIITDVQCPRCGYAVENILLVLRDCFHAKKVWSSLLNSTCRDEFFNMSLENWIVINLRSPRRLLENWPRKCTNKVLAPLTIKSFTNKVLAPLAMESP